MDFTKITLGELLSHPNETIKRNAISILKTLQALFPKKKTKVHICYCDESGLSVPHYTDDH